MSTDAESSYLFYSDFNCPFCYALNERLIAVGDKGRIGWRGIQHMPAAASINRTWEEQVMINNEVSVIRRRAPEIPIATPEFRPNTLPPNRLMAALIQANEGDNLSELRTAIYRAYWLDGRDISDHAVLAELTQAAGFTFPDGLDTPEKTKALDETLDEYQSEWEGERFHSRLPAMLSTRVDKPMLGFPALDFLYNFFNDASLPVAPESLAACELKPKQHILLIGKDIDERCNMVELKPAYHLHYAENVKDGRVAIDDRSCPPDLVLIDYVSTGQEGLSLLPELRRDPQMRSVPMVVLLPEVDDNLELAAFDVGATDVMFNLSNQKVCQARLEVHLRSRRNGALLGSMARFDYLTELPNRREFDRRLESEWMRARRTKKPVSLALLDIDHFKLYNDNLGHSTGDDCLRQVAAALRRAARRASDMVARYGGEEFGVVLAETSREAACTRAQVICDAVSGIGLPHPESSAGTVVTISVGVATLIPTDETSPMDLLRTADAALYDAKEGGRNQYRCRTEIVPPEAAH